jgi:hypothetical protein
MAAVAGAGKESSAAAVFLFDVAPIEEDGLRTPRAEEIEAEWRRAKENEEVKELPLQLGGDLKKKKKKKKIATFEQPCFESKLRHPREWIADEEESERENESARLLPFYCAAV